MTPEQERAEQIANVETAWRLGEITTEFLEWYRRLTAKVIACLEAAPAAESEQG